MGELYNPFPKLPKNIRQIGEKDSVARLYVEDYVNTYLKRLYPAAGQELRVGLLLGSMEMNDGTPYLFIDGALEMEHVAGEGGKVEFSELAWKKAYQSMEQLFPKRDIQGWFLCGAPGSDLTPLNYWKQHVRYFQGPDKLMYLNCGAEGEESIYITSEDGFYKLKGYNIYYERNQLMQDYMVLRKDVARVEAGSDDKVIREFRRRMDERHDAASDRRQSLGLMRGLTTAMSVVILAGGIVMFNNYQKMKEMESVITSALPEKAANVISGQKDTAGSEKQNVPVIIEEVEDGLTPSAGTGETMAGTQPGTPGAQPVTQPGTSGAQPGTPGTQPGTPNAQAVTPDVQSGTLNAQTVTPNAQTVTPGADGTGTTGTGGAAGQSGSSGAAGGQDGSGTAGTQAGSQSGQSGSAAGQSQASAGQSGSQSAQRNESQTGQSGSAQTAQNSATQPVKPVSIPAGATIHVIKDGETLYGICLETYHGINRLEEICQLNGLEDEDKIVAGQELILPQP